jgi:VIT1/CCC1 family predicted Fe2+/Mn2+ transporter
MKTLSVRDFRNPGLKLSATEISTFAKAWLEHESKQDEESSSLSSVDEALLFGATANPDACLDIIIAISSLTEDENRLITLGVGALEDLMRISGRKLADRVKQEYENNSSFKKALESVYLSEESDGYGVVKNLIGEFQYL